MILIYGLGNNQFKYLKNRHNAGRILVEDLASNLNLIWQKKNSGYYAKYKFPLNKNSKEDLVLFYSDGFMNESGRALLQFWKYLSLKKNQQPVLLIVQDDSDMETGKFKLVEKGGSAGHKGIDDINKEFLSLKPSPVMYRLKIGVRPKGNTLKSETFVLKDLNLKEINFIKSIALKLSKNLQFLAEKNPSKLSNYLYL